MKTRWMKPTALVLLAVFVCCLLAGCGNGAGSQSQPAAPAATPTSAPTAVPEPHDEPTSTPAPKTRPIAVDENGFIATGREIADGFMEMIKPGFLFKSVTPIVEQTSIEWDSQHSEYTIRCGLPDCVGHIGFYSGGIFESRDVVPSEVVVLSFPLTNASQEEQETFVSYARALVYLCSTCESGLEANELLQSALSYADDSMSKWVEHGAMKYNLTLTTGSDGAPLFFLSIKGPEHGSTAAAPSSQASGTASLPTCGAAVNKNGFCVNTGTLFDMVEALITNKNSDFYAGEVAEIKRSDGICSIRYPDSDALFSIMPSKKDEGTLNDNSPFTLIIFISLNLSENDTTALLNIGSAVLYLTDPDLSSYKLASDTMTALLKDMGKWTQKGKMEYSISVEGGMVGLAVREIAYYAD